MVPTLVHLHHTKNLRPMNVYPAEKSCILLIGDNVITLRFLWNILTQAVFLVLTANNRHQGLELAQTEKPDLIILDLVMPGLNGIDVCHILKSCPATQHIPVILMTRITDSDAQIKVWEAGADDYLLKPLQEVEVLMRVNTHLQIQQQRQQILEQYLLLEQLQAENYEFRRLAYLDDLTQLANRRRFDIYIHEIWEQCRGDYLSVIVCDVDCFKSYNDTYGHLAGDFCLQQVAHCIQKSVADSFLDNSYLVARYGGEEFAIVLPRVPPPDSITIAEQIRHHIYQLKIPHHPSGISEYLTLSCGISSQIVSESSYSQLLIRTADNALYEAKAQGRNCCCFQS